ncbi:FHA domain-containing protein [Kiritimatiellaeota bacterium B1221]|nr:FHA domain-containing protein [Kiritimatiellaeota bacterium B1221]
MDTKAPHLLIEEGPEKGREITIPANGARIGRAEENDIRISDAAMSRFQCRMYFRDDFLHIMDLGSTNESLVNNKPVSDVALRFGDEILIGESLIKVLNDGLHEKSEQPPAPAPGTNEIDAEPAPIIFHMGNETPEPEKSPEPETKTPSLVDVDLGLGRREDLEEAKEKGSPRNGLSMLLVTLVTMLVVFGAGFLIIMKSAPPPKVRVAEDNSLQIYYEKVIAGDGNIFRYALDLGPGGKVTAAVHDLVQQQSITRDETIDPDQLESLRKQLVGNKDSFISLQGEYEGLPVGEHESYRITVIYGKDAKTVRVANQLEPDAFKQVREKIEAFANNELGLNNIHIPPEKLRALAAESWENAQQLYIERDVKNGNLWQATQKLKDVISLLETIEPKPEYYQEAVILRQEWLESLLLHIRNMEFEAIRQHTLGEISKSIELNRRIIATFPDKTHTEYKEAVNRLNQIDQERL